MAPIELYVTEETTSAKSHQMLRAADRTVAFLDTLAGRVTAIALPPEEGHSRRLIAQFPLIDETLVTQEVGKASSGDYDRVPVLRTEPYQTLDKEGNNIRITIEAKSLSLN